MFGRTISWICARIAAEPVMRNDQLQYAHLHTQCERTVSLWGVGMSHVIREIGQDLPRIRTGCRKSARPGVCPAKAGMFSRRKACRGKS